MISFYELINHQPKNYHLFISHAWDYSEQYDTIEEWLNKNNINFSNYSVPKYNPLDVSNNRELKEALYERIRLSSGIIIITGMYVNYREWIDYELESARSLKKPIIGIIPRGHERIPLKIKENATTLVGWNATSLIKAIEKYC